LRLDLPLNRRGLSVESGNAMNDAATIKQLCDEQNLKLAVAESVTVGRIQAQIGSVSGASTYFQGGVVAYNLDQKVALLGVERVHAAAVDCVSPRVAQEMARGIARLFRATIAVGITGYAEPAAAGVDSSVQAFYAIWDQRNPDLQTAVATRFAHRGLDRCAVQQAFAEDALQALMRYLLRAG
jgi:nicotinamide-nucleotide amidase